MMAGSERSWRRLAAWLLAAGLVAAGAGSAGCSGGSGGGKGGDPTPDGSMDGGPGAADSGAADSGAADGGAAADAGGQPDGGGVADGGGGGEDGGVPPDGGVDGGPGAGDGGTDGGGAAADGGDDLLPLGPDERDTAWLFEPDSLAELHLTLDPDDLAWLWTEEGRYTEEYRPVSRLRYLRDGRVTELADVGLRPRGNTSRDKNRLPLRISLNETVRGQRLFGVEKLNLNPDTNDPTLARRYLTHHLIGRLGIPTSLVTHVRVYANGHYLGPYILTENVDDRFVRRAFGDRDPGPLFKCLWPAPLTERSAAELAAAVHEPHGPRPPGRAYELQEGDEATAYEELAELARLLQSGPSEEELRSALALDDLLWSLAVQALVGHWDGYWCNRQNYYLYRSPGDGLWHFIEYDTDNTFGIDYIGYDSGWDLRRWAFADAPGWADARPATRPLVAAALGLLGERYEDELRAIAARFLAAGSPDDLAAEARRVHDRLRQSVIDDLDNPDPWLDNRYGSAAGDMTGWTLDDFDRSFGADYAREQVEQGIEEFLRAIATQVELQLGPG